MPSALDGGPCTWHGQPSAAPVAIINNRIRAPDMVHIFISEIPIFSLNPMFDSLLESSHRDDSNKWSNIGFGEEITQVESTKVHFMHLIWSSDGMLGNS